ncbi:DNA primase small subunit domain-containing protein [Oerskovia sp. M15]
MRELLGELGLEGFPKTSGGRGLHVFVPVEPRWSFVQARRATIAIGRELERRLPDQVTTKWWKEERGVKIFVDYNQMARDRTIASAYSIRSNARATVSAPLLWEEVSDVGPDDFDVLTMPARFAEVGDLHARLDAAAPSPASRSRRRSNSRPVTSAITAWATCRTRPSTPRCRASPSVCSRARTPRGTRSTTSTPTDGQRAPRLRRGGDETAGPRGGDETAGPRGHAPDLSPERRPQAASFQGTPTTRARALSTGCATWLHTQSTLRHPKVPTSLTFPALSIARYCRVILRLGT